MSIFSKIMLLLLAVVLILGALAACSPLQALNAVTPADTYRKVVDIAYASDPRQQLDIYMPLNGSGAAPVVVFFYGGNWNSGARQQYQFVGEALAARGFVTVVADYRLYPQVRYPGFIEDSAHAVAWTLAEIQRYGGDPKKVYVMGHSAGAYNASMVALDPRWLGAHGVSPSALRGWIGLAGPYDFIPIQNPDTRPVFFYPDTPPASQPINHVSADAPPTLLLASRNDKLVNPQRNTGGMARKLRGAGVPVTEMYFDKTSHTTLIGAIAWPLRSLAPVLESVEQFIAADGGRHIAIAPALPGDYPAPVSQIR